MSISAQRANCGASVANVSGSAASMPSSVSSEKTTPKPNVSSAALRSWTTTSWAGSRRLARIAKYSPAGPPPTIAILTAAPPLPAGSGDHMARAAARTQAAPAAGYGPPGPGWVPASGGRSGDAGRRAPVRGDVRADGAGGEHAEADAERDRQAEQDERDREAVVGVRCGPPAGWRARTGCGWPGTAAGSAASLWAAMLAEVDACGTCGRAVAGSVAGRAEAAGAAIARIAAVMRRRRVVFMQRTLPPARCRPVTAP